MVVCIKAKRKQHEKIHAHNLQMSLAWIPTSCRHKHSSVNNFHLLKDLLSHSALSWSSGAIQLQWWRAVELVVGGMNGHLWIDENDSTESLRALCSVTYEGLWKALLKEDAGRAHNVVQHVAVLHQRTKGVVEQFLLHVLILCCVHSPHFPIHYPLQRQTVLLPPLRHTLSAQPMNVIIFLRQGWHALSSSESDVKIILHQLYPKALFSVRLHPAALTVMWFKWIFL